MKPFLLFLYLFFFWSPLQALAGSIEYWKFNVQLSRLEIVTDADVKPTAQLLANPTRLSIDLPGIRVSGRTTKKRVTSFIREVRIGQFNPQTARMVVELDPSYSMRPWEVKVRSLAPNRWYVQLPKFQPLEVYTLPGNRTVSVRVPPPRPRPKSRHTIVIDPGHGGKDPGAIGLGSLQEKRVVLSISSQVAKRLKQQGVRVVMTRASDRFISLKGRVDAAERAKASAFVSIHANAVGGGRTGVNGLETYYYDTGLSLARSIHRSILRRINVRDRRVRRARFFVLRRTSMPAVLVEVGFLTGRTDNRNLASSNYRQRMGDAISQGIVEYLR